MSFLLRRAMMSAGAVGSSGDPYFEQVTLLLHMAGADGGVSFTDSSTIANTVTASGATTSTTQFKFGTASEKLNTNASTIYFPNSATSPTGSGQDWTIEGWIYPTANPGTVVCIYMSGYPIQLYLNSLAPYIYLSHTNSSSYFAAGGTVNVSLNAWNHIAIVKYGQIHTLYVNGVVSYTITSASVVAAPTLTNGYLGKDLNFNTSTFAGYVDEFRITRNVARYTAAFTPPTAAFPNSSGNTYATWNPSDKAASITLSSGDLVAQSTTTASTVRSTFGKSSGKWYWEVSVVAGTYYACHIGCAVGSSSVNSTPGTPANTVGLRADGYKEVGGSGGSGPSFNINDIVGFALDMDSGTLSAYINGVSAGTVATGLSGTQYAATGSNIIASAQVRANFGASAFSYSVPSGYNAGLYN